MSKGINVDFPTHLKISNIWSILFTVVTLSLTVAGFYYGIVKDTTQTQGQLNELNKKVNEQQIIIDKYREQIPVLEDRVSGMNRVLGVATQSAQIKHR